MPNRLTDFFLGGNPIVNLIVFLGLAVAGLLAVVFVSIASTAQDWEWYKTGFNDLPDRLIIYNAGTQTELLPGQPGFDPLAEAVRATLAQGVEANSHTGLSQASLNEAYKRYLTLEIFFARPVKLHAWFYTNTPTRMLMPVTGRHSDWPIIFLGDGLEYWLDAPVLKTKEPILQVLRELGYLAENSG